MPSARIVQITDTHLYADPARRYRRVDTRASLAAVLDHVRSARRPPDALLLTGDLVEDESPGGYAALAGLLAPLDVLALAVPGNHDDPEALAAVGGRRLRIGGSHRIGAWHVVLLHSRVAGAAHGVLAGPELAFLRDALSREPDRPTLIALHHPPLPLGSRWIDALGLGNADALFGVLVGHPQVKAVAYGHAHQVFDAIRDGVRYLCTPSTAAQFLAGADEFAVDTTLAPGYRWFELGNDGGFDTGVERVALC